MATPAQIAANAQNAKHSTGPRTEQGKAASSSNGITHGLYSRKGFIRPQDDPLYDQLHAELLAELTPAGPHEEALAGEAFRAIWRLRRCAEVEANLADKLTRLHGHDKAGIPDPMEALGDSERIQNSVDRARSQAHRLLRQSTIELRKLQAARREAAIKAVSDEALKPKSETHPENATRTQSGAGAASSRHPYPVPVQTPLTMRTQSEHAENPEIAFPGNEIPGNAPCSCGSREVYQRCCGTIARPHQQAA